MITKNQVFNYIFFPQYIMKVHWKKTTSTKAQNDNKIEKLTKLTEINEDGNDNLL